MDDRSKSTSTVGSVQKSGSVLGVAAGLGVIVVVLAMFGGDGFSSEDDTAPIITMAPDPAPTEASNEQPPITTAPAPSTTRTTVRPGQAADPVVAMPERGLFREALEATLTEECTDIVDGPEPASNQLYDLHDRCVEEALVDIENRCRLAAAVFYVLPGDEALDIACDKEGPER